MQKAETVRTLNSLIRACRSTEEVAQACARTVASPGIKRLLRARAEEWDRQGDELQALVLMLGGVPARRATAGSGWLSAWIAIKAAALGASDARSLDACQHAQLRALHRYDHAIGGYLPERIRRTLTLHADRISARNEVLSELLERLSAPAQAA